MPRVIKRADVRQDEILDTAMRLFAQRGYAATSVQAIIDEVGIAKGTFYHHYPSKSDLLDALVHRMVRQMLAAFEPIVADPHLDAITKLNTMYSSAMTWKTERREELIEVRRGIDSDANVELRHRLERDSAQEFLPMVRRILEQGVSEGAFDTRYPAQAAAAMHVISLTSFENLRVALTYGAAPMPTLTEITRDVDAFHDHVERLLGARRGSLKLVDIDEIALWLHMLHAERSA